MWVMLLDACGFALQILPCLLLCLLPFRAEQYRYSKRICLLVLFSVLAAASVGFSVIMQPLYQEDRRLDSELAANLYMMMVLLVYILSFFFVIRDDFRKKILILCLVLTYAIIIYVCVNATIMLFPQYNQSIVKYRPIVLLAYALFSGITLPFAWMAMRYMVRQYLQDLQPKMLRQSLAMVLVLLGLYFLFIFSITPNLYRSTETDIEISFYLSHLAAFLFCTASLMVALWLLFWEIRSIEMRLQVKNQLEIQQLQYEKFQKDMEMARRSRHDIRHHMHTLDSLLATGKIQEAKDYLQTLEKHSHYSDPQKFCDDPMLNALLQYYAAESENYGISFICSVSIGLCPIDAADMTVLLGNCLDNAVNSCREVAGKRVIRLKLRQVNSTIAILMENSCGRVQYAELNKKNEGYLESGAYFSLRKDGGIGLTSIGAMAKKYSGLAQFKFEPPLFYTRISLEIPEKQSKSV